MPTFRGHIAFSGSHHRLGWAIHQQAPTGHPEVRQSKQSVQLLGVFSQASVANFYMAKLAFDHSKWVFDLGPNLGFDLLKLLLQGGYRLLWIERFAFATFHGDMPTQLALGCLRRHVGTFVSALIARIAIAIDFLPVQQAVGFGHITDVGCGATHGVHQARIGIHANMGLGNPPINHRSEK